MKNSLIKHERFVKVVEKRMNTIIDDLEKLGNCASKVSYEYSEDEVERIINELQQQIVLLKERFDGKKAFSLSDASTDE